MCLRIWQNALLRKLTAKTARPRHPRPGGTDWTPLDVVEAVGFGELPIDPHRIASSFDIEVVGGALNGISGCLMCFGSEVKIVFATRSGNRGFQRFTVAHELGHYFHPGHLDELFGNGETLHQSRGGFSSNQRIERQADNYAVELLMPEALFRPAMARAGRGLAAIKALAALCKTSLTATAIRYAGLTREPVLVTVGDGRTIEYAVRSPGLRGINAFSLRGELVPEDSLTRTYGKFPEKIRQRSQEESDTRLSEWLPTGSTDWFVEECFGLGRYNRVLTVISLD